MLIGAVAALKTVLHLWALTGYGYFRDELYYLACADNPAWGYVDHPPFSVAFLAVWRFIFGDSLFSIRLVPALSGVATVVLIGLMTKQLGGKSFSLLCSTLAATVSIIYLGFGAYCSMNSFDILFWALAAYFLIRILKREPDGDTPSQNALPATALWLWLGAILGLGLLNKISVLWLGAGITMGLLATSPKSFLTKEPYLAAIVALLLFLPHVLWQLATGFPTLEFIRNASAGKYVVQSPTGFLAGVTAVMNPVTLPVWLAGLFYLLFTERGRRWRLLGIAFLTVLLILLFNPTSKAEYLAAAFTLLLPAGGAALESLVERFKLAWAKPVLVAVLLLGLGLAPISLPVLPVETYIAYADALGIKPSTSERKELSELPQHYADRFGWENLAATVTTVYQSLSPDEQARCGIFAFNYGDAGAIDFFGRAAGLPKALSGHNNYFLWGTRGQSPDIFIIVGGQRGDSATGHLRVFAEAEEIARVHSRYAMPYETNLPVFICRRPNIPIAILWEQLKHYD